MSKNRSPPHRPRSLSASTTSESNPTEADLSHTKSSNKRRDRPRVADRRVHFVPGEQVTDPKDNVMSDDSVTSKSPARNPPAAQPIQIPHSDSPSQTVGTGPGRATLTTFGPAPTENTRLIEETSSDESEDSGSRSHDTVKIRARSQRGDNIRSGIKDLLEANREVPIVDANTATVLESLLSQMNQGRGDGLVSSPFPPSVWTNDSVFRVLASPGPAGLPSRVRTGARFVGRLHLKPFSLTV